MRLTALGEAFGEPEQDANSALTELDKGLRSGHVGEQCEAIVRFPRLFEKYPFPILINSSFLKLADVFRVGNNFLRLWILKVCQQSEKHLDKILNVDEFVRRIFSVMHSNDPVARSLSLRTLGSVACVIPERQQVHHIIRGCLDSHDSVEVEAAIYAAMQYAAQSKSFALGMCNQISDMIQGLATPADMKLQLIPILQYMHHDTSTAAMVRQVCTDLLPKYPAKDFVVTTLNTLTKLAVATLVDLPDQVELLLEYLVQDSRWGVKKVILLCLYQLAKTGPNLWPSESVLKAIQITRSSTDQLFTSLALDVFIVLTKSPVVCHEYVDPDSELMQLCQETCYSSNPIVSAKSVRIITHIVSFCFQEGVAISDVEEYINTVESLLLLVSCQPASVDNDVLKSCLHSAVSLCKVYRPISDRFIDLIATQLIAASGTCCTLLCEALGGIGGLEPSALEAYMPDIVKKLNQISGHSSIVENKNKMKLCTLMLQGIHPGDWSQETEAAINSVVATTDLWTNYRIARTAARYGHYKVASQIVSALRDKVSSESLHFWLEALYQIGCGETALINAEKTLLERLEEAVTHYNIGIASLRAGSSPSKSLSFQCEFISLRCELLQCFSQLISSCNSLCFSPPPAIAVTIVHTTRDDLQRFGHVTNQLRKCAKDFRNCGDLYWKLYQSAFDADPATLTNIQILQHVCMLMAYSIDTISLQNNQGDEPVLDSTLKDSCIETQLMIHSCQAASNLIRTLDRISDPSGSTQSKCITHQHINCLIKQVEVITSGPFCLPRYFFQVLQSTSIKLAVSPQPRVNGEWVTVTSGSHLAVKVEGVIQHGARPGLFRSVEKVTVSLTTQPNARSYNEKSDFGLSLTQTVVPHKDFFTAQFLVSLGTGGAQATVNVSAAVIDQSDSVWQTGPKSTLTIKQHDDPSSRAH